MSLETRTKLLGEVAKSRTDISNKFTNRFVELQGIQEGLKKLYKPITTAIGEQPKTIIAKIEETNRKIGELSASTKSSSREVKDKIEELKQQQHLNERILNRIYASPN